MVKKLIYHFSRGTYWIRIQDSLFISSYETRIVGFTYAISSVFLVRIKKVPIDQTLFTSVRSIGTIESNSYLLTGPFVISVSVELIAKTFPLTPLMPKPPNRFVCMSRYFSAVSFVSNK